ncbi:mRNA cleavage and polyadenylation factor subunit [Gurleya vavrai]
MSLSALRGNIAICQGTRVMVYKFDRLNGLTAIAFHDLHVISTSLATSKNLILVSDLLKGVSFFYFQNRPVKIHKLSMSEDIKNVNHVMLLTIKNELIMLVFDDRNMHLYTYSPQNIYSKDGEFLIKRGEVDIFDKIIGSGKDFFYSSNTIYKLNKDFYENNSKYYKVNKPSLKMITVKGIFDVNEWLENQNFDEEINIL